MNVRTAMILLTVVLAACAARSPARATAPPASREALAVKPVAWSARDTSVALLPKTAGRVQIVITPGWAAGEHYVWLVSHGTDVIRVYRTTSSEVADIVEAAVRMIHPTTSTPLDKLSFGVMGSIHKPPPPEPGPGGLPELYVQQVMKTAWGMNHEQAQIDGEVVGP